MSQLFEGVEGVLCYMKDILIYGKDMEEHDRRLSTVMKTVISSGLNLNESKCLFKQLDLKFLGHKFTAEGFIADPDKVTAILGIPAPTSVALLVQFRVWSITLGSICQTYTMSHVHWMTYSKEMQLGSGVSIKKVLLVKEMVSSTSVLAYYDGAKLTCVSADASSYGIGGVTLQDQGGGQMKPVAFCSRMLTPTE